MLGHFARPRALCFVGVMTLVMLLGQASPAFAQDQTPGATLVNETWEAVFLNGVKVGYGRLHTQKRTVAKQTIYHTTRHMVMKINRGGDTAQVQMTNHQFELATGWLYGLETKQELGGQASVLIGRYRDGTMTLTTTAGDQTDSKAIAWPRDVVGEYTIRQKLEEKPLAPGQSRTFKTFVDVIGKVGEITFDAKDYETTTLSDGSKLKLLKIEQKIKGVDDFTTYVWTDAKGQFVKTTAPLMGMDFASYKVSKEVALSDPAQKVPDLFRITQVRAVTPDKKLHEALSAEVEFALDKIDPADALATAEYQKILENKAGTVRLQLSKAVPLGESKVTLPNDSEFLTSNTFIQSDNKKIIATAQAVTKGITDPWKKAQALEKWVSEKMSDANFTVAFASAGDVIESLKGDCTEHAVLLAALCRAAGVPARVAMGLVYVPSRDYFLYHMWTEVNINGKWYGIDGTLGQGSLGAGHIKITDSSLAGGVTSLSAFLPIFKVIKAFKNKRVVVKKVAHLPQK